VGIRELDNRPQGEGALITSFHGLRAYRGSSTPLGILRAAKTALSGVEICTADRPIGPIGLAVFGHASAVFERDVWSEVNHGQRVGCGRYYREDGGQDWYPLSAVELAQEWELGAIFDAPSQQDYESFCAAHRYHDKHYCEPWVEAEACRAIWVKDWAPARDKKIARLVAKILGVPFVEITQSCRIEDFLDEHSLPVRICRQHGKTRRSGRRTAQCSA